MKTKMLIKALIGIIVIGSGLSYFVYQAMKSSWSYYYSVDDFSNNASTVKNNSLRIAGVVKPGSIERDLQQMNLKFVLTGSKAQVPVSYKGLVPENFAEDREVVVEGHLDTTGAFQATMLLTKCESKYKTKVR